MKCRHAYESMSQVGRQVKSELEVISVQDKSNSTKTCKAYSAVKMAEPLRLNTGRRSVVE